MHSQDFKNLMLRLACLVLALTWGTSAQAQFLLTGNSGAEWQIGTGLPLPIGPNGIYTGGMTNMDGGPANWPDLLVPPRPDLLWGPGLSGAPSLDRTESCGAAEAIRKWSGSVRGAPGDSAFSLGMGQFLSDSR